MLHRRLAVILCAALLSLGLGGCLTQNRIRSEVSSTLAARYGLWLDEARGRASERRLLGGGLTLHESVRIALENSPTLEVAKLQQQIAEDQIVQALAGALPTVDLYATYTRLDQLSSFGTTQTGSKDNYAAGTNITQPLYRGGAISAGIRGAQLFRSLTAEQLRGARQNLTFGVRKAYYDALLATALERASSEAVTVAQRLLEDAKKNKEAGTASNFDVLRADVEVKNLLAQNVNDQNAAKLAVTSLLNLMGVSQESRVDLTDKLESDFDPFEPLLEETMRTAFQQHPNLIQSELTVRIQREIVTAAWADMYPKLDAFFNWAEQRPDPHNPAYTHAFNDIWSAGLTAKYTVFQGFGKWAYIRQQETVLLQQKKNLQLAEDQVLLQVRQATLSLKDAERLVESQKANVQQAEEALRLVLLGAKEGTRKQVEVLDARRALTQAQATLAQAHYSFAIAKLQFEQAIGALDADTTGAVSLPQNVIAPKAAVAPASAQ